MYEQLIKDVNKTLGRTALSFEQLEMVINDRETLIILNNNNNNNNINYNKKFFVFNNMEGKITEC